MDHSILIVEPDPVQAATLEQAFAAAGYAGRVVRLRKEALQVWRSRRFNLAVVDLELPGSSGLELGRELLRLNPQAGLVFLAGSGDYAQAVQALRMGALDLLAKPVEPAEAAAALTRWLERSCLADLAFQAQQQYAHLVQNIPLVIFSLRADGVLDYINRACLECFGWEPSEAVGRPGWLADRVHPADRLWFTDLLAQAHETARPFSVQCRMLHRSGRHLTCIVKSIPGLDRLEAKGEPGPRLRIEGVILDITDRVMLERALVEDEKLKTLGAVASEVAHEIRNPLMSIGGFSRRLQRRAPSREIDIILRETARLEKLLDRIRGYLRPLRLSRCRVDVNAVVQECVNLLCLELHSRDRSCAVELTPELPRVWADPDLLSQVVVHLLAGAMDTPERVDKSGLGPDGGRVLVHTAASGGFVELRIAVPTEQVLADGERRYLPFEEQGPGMSLALSYRLVKTMGGLLSCSLESGNAIFAVTLPAMEGQGEPTTSETPLGREDPEGPRMAEDDGFDEQLSREWRRSAREFIPLAILLVEVDHFDAFVAHHGRRASELAMDRVERALRSGLHRPGDFLERHGQQRFTVVLPGTNELGAVLAAEEMRQSVEELGIAHPASAAAPRLTVSMGVAATVPGDGSSPRDLYAEALRALYAATQAGCNQARCAGQRRSLDDPEAR